MNADARNSKVKSTSFINKADWIDAEGKSLGNREVYLRVIKLSRNFIVKII